MKEVTDELLDGRPSRCSSSRSTSCSARSRSRSQASAAARVNRQTQRCPPDLAAAVAASLDEWRKPARSARSWARDASLWTGDDEAQLARLARHRRERSASGRPSSQRSPTRSSSAGVHARRPARHGRLEPVPRRAGARPSARVAGFPSCTSSTRPSPRRSRPSRRRSTSRRRCSSSSSKSGSTLEPNVFEQYFFDASRRRSAPSEAGQRFVADHRSGLEAAAGGRAQNGFRHIFSASRRSAAATRRCRISAWFRRRRWASTSSGFLGRAERMVHACAPRVPPARTPASRSARSSASPRSAGATS